MGPSGSGLRHHFDHPDFDHIDFDDVHQFDFDFLYFDDVHQFNFDFDHVEYGTQHHQHVGAADFDLHSDFDHVDECPDRGHAELHQDGPVGDASRG